MHGISTCSLHMLFIHFPFFQSVWLCHSSHIFPEHADPHSSTSTFWMCHHCQDISRTCGGAWFFLKALKQAMRNICISVLPGNLIRVSFTPQPTGGFISSLSWYLGKMGSASREESSGHNSLLWWVLQSFSLPRNQNVRNVISSTLLIPI